MKRQRELIIEQLQQQWTCPITSMPMTDPVITEDGHSYEKRQITAWLKKQKSSPKTGLTLKKVGVIPNIALRNVIQKFQTQIKYQIQKLKTQNQQLVTKLAQQQEQIRQLEEMKLRNKSLEQQKTTLESKFIQISKNYEQLLQKQKQVAEIFDTMQKENDQLQRQNTKLREQLVVSNNKLAENKKQLTMVNEQTCKLKQQLVQIKKELQQQKKSKSLKEENQQLKKRNSQLILQNSGLNMIIDNFSTYKTNFQQAKKNFQQELQNMLSLKSQVEKQRVRNQNVIKEKDKQIQKIKVQVQMLRKQNNNLKVDSIQKSNELKNLLSQTDKLKKYFQQHKKLAREQLQRKELQMLINFTEQQERFQHEMMMVDQQMEQKVDKDIQEKVQEKQEQKQQMESIESFLNKKQQNRYRMIANGDDNNLLVHRPKLNQIRQRIQKLQQMAGLINKNLTESKGKKTVSKIMLNSITGQLQNYENQQDQYFPFVNDKEVEKQAKLLKSKQKVNKQKGNNQKNIVINKRSPQQQQYGNVILKAFGVKNPIKQPVKKKKKNQAIKNILPFQDYLMTNPVLFDEEKRKLDHSGQKINMKEFLMYNWQEIMFFNFNSCQIDDKGFQMFIQHAAHFPNVNFLLLWSNSITNLPKDCLEKFPNLKAVYFSVEGKASNPLNESSKNYLENFKKKNPKIAVHYQSF